MQNPALAPELNPARSTTAVTAACGQANSRDVVYAREWTAHVLERMLDQDVLPQVVQALLPRALELSVGTVRAATCSTGWSSRLISARRNGLANRNA